MLFDKTLGRFHTIHYWLHHFSCPFTDTVAAIHARPNAVCQRISYTPYLPYVSMNSPTAIRKNNVTQFAQHYYYHVANTKAAPESPRTSLVFATLPPSFSIFLSMLYLPKTQCLIVVPPTARRLQVEEEATTYISF